MNEPVAPWKRIVFKRLVEGDYKKLEAESNNAPTGGGARDFRFSPMDRFWPVFERMFPNQNSSGDLEASLLWDGGLITTTTIKKPTPSRSNECRIATVHECCPSQFVPKETEKSIFLLAQDSYGVRALFLTEAILTKRDWSHATKRFFTQFLSLPIPGNSTPAGYVDFETNDQHTNTPLKMQTAPWNEFPPFEPFSYQRIYYGAPGTGKSYRTNEIAAAFPDTIRTTFHPDSDYASFVGSYKPTMRMPKPDEKTEIWTLKPTVTGSTRIQEGEHIPKGVRIAYEFVPQAFTDAYVQAWEKLAKTPADGKPDAQFLVIEEINRGNCAQVFGDLFQLLDRHDNGFSQYPINADADLRAHLEKRLSSATADPAIVARIDLMLAEAKTKATWEDIRKGNKLVLPPNLFIWATMNTSDQSLFPMDSAFKRRWDWKYVPITEHKEENYKIEIDGATYDWWLFVKAINERIFGATESEDKKLGYFFVKAEKKDGVNVIDAERFLNKVVFYLWNDVFKNSEPEKAFKFTRPDKKESIATFQDFFNEETGERDDAMLKAFLAGLELDSEESKSTESTPPDAATDETGLDGSPSGALADAPTAVDAPAASATDATEADGGDTANA